MLTLSDFSGFIGFKIWVYGNSFKSLLVAVVVLHEVNTKKWANSNGHTCSFTELCSLDQLKNYVLAELKLTAERNKVFNPFVFYKYLKIFFLFLKKKKNFGHQR